MNILGKIIVLVFSLLFLLPEKQYAADFSARTSALSGNSIAVDSSRSIGVSDLLGTLDTTCSLISLRTSGLVRFYANPVYGTVITDGYVAELRVRIYTSATDSLDDTLIVKYDPGVNVVNDFLNYRKFEGIDSIRFKVLGLTVTWNGSGSGTPGNLVLEGEFFVSQQVRFHQLSYKQTELLGRQVVDGINPHVYQSTTNELTVSWSPICSADAYELEWTYIDIFDESSDVNDIVEDSTDVRFSFNKDATRVRLDNVYSYNIPLLYERGYLAYRYRPILLDDSSGTILEVAGPWSTFPRRFGTLHTTGYYNYIGDPDFVAEEYPNNSFLLGRYSPNYLFRISSAYSHEDSLGWQSSITFAEEAKRKGVISYFDGTMRNRQTVTYNNHDSLVIVAESIYDYHGRAAAQILPAPVVSGGTQSISRVIQYFEAFNRVNADTGIVARHFAADDISNCSFQPDTLYAGRGAALYYSPNNGQQTTYQAFLPDAEGYPFTVTEFTPDNTGRVQSQSGVGYAHQLGSGHETKNYYGTPTYNEIVRLFGDNNVGEISHYFKNMVVDPNGTTSISYVDMHGRTIATAMAGYADTNLVNLASNDQEADFTELDLIQNSASAFIEDSLAYVLNKAFLVPARGWYYFDYSITAGDISDSLCSVCYNCVYDLSISIKDNRCSEEYFNGQNGLSRTIGSASFGCGLVPDSIKSFSISDSIFLEPGAYTLVKQIKINPDTLAKYQQQFVDSNTCLVTRQDFIDDAFADLDTSDCTRDCAACDTLYGTESDFITTYIGSLIASGVDSIDLAEEDTLAGIQHYNNTIAECRRIYCDEQESECATYLKAMVADVSPGGQYFSYRTNESGVLESTGDFSILKSGRFNNSTNVYVNTSGFRERFLSDTLSVTWFVRNWQPSWADSLVKYHPEYPLYKWCLVMDSSTRYDWAMQGIDKYSEAVATGFINPLNMDSATTAGLPTQNDTLDPFFEHIFEQYVICDDLKARMQEDLENFSSSGLSYWQQAAVNVNCVPNNSFDLNACIGQYRDTFGKSSLDTINDQAWQNFRSLYLLRKKYWVERCRKECTGSTFLPDNRPALRAIGFRVNFPETTDIFGSYTYIGEDGKPQTTGIGSAQPTTTDGYRSLANQKLAEHCNLLCAGQVTNWLSDFSGCLDTLKDVSTDWEADSTAIADGFIEVCVVGCDASNPFGAGQLAPGVYTPSGYNSFQDVISTVFSQYFVGTAYRSMVCDPYMLSMPPAYGGMQNLPDAPMRVADACACDKITSLWQYYETDTLLNDSTTFAVFVSDSLNTFFTDLQIEELLCACGRVCMNTNSPEITTYHSFDIDSMARVVPNRLVRLNDSLDFIVYWPGDSTELDFNSTGFIASWVNRNTREIVQSKYYYGDTSLYTISYVWVDSQDSSIILVKYPGNSSSGLIKLDFDGNVIWKKKLLGSPSFTYAMPKMMFGDGLGIRRLDDSYLISYYRNYYVKIGIDGTGLEVLRIDLDSIVSNQPYNYDNVAGNDLFSDLVLVGGKAFIAQHAGRFDVEDSTNHLISIVKIDPSNSEVDSSLTFRLNSLPDSTVYGTFNNISNLVMVEDSNHTFIVAIPVVDTLFTQDTTYNDTLATYACGLQLIRLDTNLNILSAQRLFVKDSWTDYLSTPDSIKYYSGFFWLNNARLLIDENRNIYFNTAINRIWMNGDSFDSSATDLVVLSLDSLFQPIELRSLVPTSIKQDTSYQQVVTYASVAPLQDFSDLAISANSLSHLSYGFDFANELPFNPRYAVLPLKGNFPACVGNDRYELRTEQLPILFDTLAFSLQSISFTLDTFNILVADTVIPIVPKCQTIARAPRPLVLNSGTIGGELPMPYVPAALTCNTCLSCDTVQAVWDAFWADTIYDEMAEANPSGAKLALYNYMNLHFGYTLGVQDYEHFLSTTCLADSLSQLCNRSMFERDPNLVDADEDTVSDCVALKMAAARFEAERNYQIYIEAVQQSFREQYIDTCLRTLNGFSETFTMRYIDREYHHTLYYYDQAGNLVQTVPPAGVDTVDQDHSLRTVYTYNSLNAVVKQHSPDGDTTRFGYDELGRLIASMSGKQYEQSVAMADTACFSYTLYDELNRTVQSGQVLRPISLQSAINSYFVGFEYYGLYDFAIRAAKRTEYVSTWYDTLVYDIPGFEPDSGTLRGRIAHVTYNGYFPDQTILTPGDTADYASALHYNYDIHGNVKRLITDIPMRGSQRYKTLDYSYDLISGNVHRVVYQDSAWDYFAHRYEYDADNRLRRAYTSTDGGTHWWQDARYHYYQHGPLARTELGHYQIQGQDYLYTLQGWIKGVNSASLNEQHDPGQDGFAGVNQPFALDVAAYNLSYFRDSLHGWYDYLPIGSGTPIPAVPTSSWLHQAAPSLYNGNIRHMVTSIARDFSGSGIQMHASAYRYDQLNRIVRADHALAPVPTGGDAGTWAGIARTSAWLTSYTYDPNGNLLNLKRNGNLASPDTLMDHLTYRYYAGTNRLKRVDDAVADTLYAQDLDDQDSLNYAYDRSGNLIKDLSEGIDDIDWTITGKIARVHKTDGTTLHYYYDPMGQRIAKRHISGTCQLDTLGCGCDTLTTHTRTIRTTWYLRDAQGNVISVYTDTLSTQQKADTLTTTHRHHLAEQHLYGSSRIGVHYRRLRQLADSTVTLDGDTLHHSQDSLHHALNDSIVTQHLGQKQYELSNHLGNVLASITDRKLPVDTNANDLTDYYVADMLSATDYYPFGAPLPGRTWQPDSITVMADTCISCDQLRTLLDGYTGTYTDTTALKTWLDSVQTIDDFTTAEYIQALKDCEIFVPERAYAATGGHYFVDNAAHDVGTRDFTISAWIRRNNNTAANQIIVGKVQMSSSKEIGYKLYLNSSTGANTLVFSVGDGTGSGSGNFGRIRTNSGLILPNIWYHVVVQRIGNDANNWKIYVNGIQATLASIPSGDNQLTTGNADNTDSLELARPIKSSTAYYDGRLADLRLYKRTLSAAEVANLYHGCTQPSADSLMYHLLLDEYSGTPQDIINNLSSTASGTGHSIVQRMRSQMCPDLANVRRYTGNGDYFYPDAAAHDVGTRRFTLSFRAKVDTVGHVIPFSKMNLSSGTVRAKGYSLWLNYPNAGQVSLVVGDSINSTNQGRAILYTTNTVIDTTRWYHITAVRGHATTTSQWKLYIDGRECTTTELSNSLTDGNLSNAAGLKLGSYRPNATPRYHKGGLSQVRMHLKALTDAEIERLYLGCDVPTDSLVYYMPLNEASGNPVDLVNPSLSSSVNGGGMSTVQRRVAGQGCASVPCGSLCRRITKRVPGALAYRYGFNGTEKSPEISEGHNTTFFREMDTRIIRWWSIDPKYKSDQSPYILLGNSPLVLVDPKGDDDYYNALGDFLYSDNKGSNIWVATGPNSKVSLSQFSANIYPKMSFSDGFLGYNSAANDAFTKIVRNYADRAFIPKDAIKGAGTHGSALAYTEDNEGSDVYINTNGIGGAMNSLLDDYNNLTNVLYHEQLHREDMAKGIHSSVDNQQHLAHAWIYVKQSQHESFEKGTTANKQRVMTLLAMYLGKEFLQQPEQSNEFGDIIKQINTSSSRLKVSWSVAPGAEDNFSITVTDTHNNSTVTVTGETINNDLKTE